MVRLEKDVNDVGGFPSGSPCPKLHLPRHGGADLAWHDKVPIQGGYGVADLPIILFETLGDVDDPHPVGEVLDLQLAPVEFGRQVSDTLVSSAELCIAMPDALFDGCA